MRELREVLEPLRDLVAGPPTEPSGAHGAPAHAFDDRTTRVPDPPGPAYTERPRDQWVRRRRFRARRKGERALVAAAALAVAGVLSVLLLPHRSAPAATPTARPAADHARTWRNPADGLEYAWIPAGTYRMGCTPGDANCDPASLPYRDVVIPAGFWMGRTEVTVGAYKRFAAATGREMPRAPSFDAGWEPAKDELPVVNVPWETAGAYCAWAGGRLPTESEWEWAERGGHPDWYFPWGNEEPVCRPGAPNGARFDDEQACHETGPERVASFAPNGYGLFDVAGYVWEWTADVWRELGERRRRVLRGGSWVNKAAYLRASIRSRWYEDGEGRDFIGLRCVVSERVR
jgi:formylglycine-generating enzyme required for sulfatase activity